ncbi:hypothetical protein SAMN05518849_101386 [Sphingobium sp. AP50]|uniref:hypothetical protein n=1 Tax=Sphingobium sp. AP50 TaxID=1884369 RepID=UPI0008CCB2BF|nr:hypothetical protein [Sphingobium sp. AP50]SEI64149.1 hypothetical protein SAMN05518849_101386 [Sphingobium sp. AP50]
MVDTGAPAVADGQDYPPPEVLKAFLLRYGFDGTTYARRNADLAGHSPEAALSHFAHHGWREGRMPGFILSMAQIQQLRLTDWSAPWTQHLAMLAMRTLIWEAQSQHRPGTLPVLADLMTGSPDHVPALVIGDSHSAFLHSGAAMLAGGVLPAPLLCRAGSARGLTNPDSRARHRDTILRTLDGLGQMLTHRPVIFQFGQVDIEFLFDMKRIRDGETRYIADEARRFIRQSIGRYGTFLAECRKHSRARFIVMGVFPPALDDATVRAGYTNAHIATLNEHDDIDMLKRQLAALEHPDAAARTALARYFNRIMRTSCTRARIGFIEEFDALLGPDGLVRRALTNPDDHHLALHSPFIHQRMTAVARQIAAMARR